MKKTRQSKSLQPRFHIYISIAYTFEESRAQKIAQKYSMPDAKQKKEESWVIMKGAQITPVYFLIRQVSLTTSNYFHMSGDWTVFPQLLSA